jgi:hypothetical protein
VHNRTCQARCVSGDGRDHVSRRARDSANASTQPPVSKGVLGMEEDRRICEPGAHPRWLEPHDVSDDKKHGDAHPTRGAHIMRNDVPSAREVHLYSTWADPVSVTTTAIAQEAARPRPPPGCSPQCDSELPCRVRDLPDIRTPRRTPLAGRVRADSAPVSTPTRVRSNPT